jgi:hypothetical protein
VSWFLLWWYPKLTSVVSSFTTERLSSSARRCGLPTVHSSSSPSSPHITTDFTNYAAAISDGNYRELRHFAPWQRPREIEDYYLEQIVGKITGQYKVPFGDAVISTRDTCLGLETCEELFTPNGYVLTYTGVEQVD